MQTAEEAQDIAPPASYEKAAAEVQDINDKMQFREAVEDDIEDAEVIDDVQEEGEDVI
jgi:hypothetical protein